MTTIALPILVMLVVILLLIIINMILWQKQASLQLNQTRNLQKQIEGLGQALRELEKQSVPTRQEMEESQFGAPEPQPEEPEAPEELLQEIQLQEDPGLPAELSEELTTLEDISQAESGSEKMEILDRGSETPEATIYNIGKSGKVYTEEELELLIKE